VGRAAAAVQNKVIELVLLVSHACNHDGGQEMRYRPGSGNGEVEIGNLRLDDSAGTHS
jgi:hypothetical protein